MNVIDTKAIVHEVYSDTTYNGMTTCGQGYWKATLETVRTWDDSRSSVPMAPIVKTRTSCLLCIGSEATPP